jgi:hypothetical protein
VGGGFTGNYWTNMLLRDLSNNPDGIIPITVK